MIQGGFASPEFVRRFQNEAEAAASLQHPNIVAIYEVGLIEGLHYFSMDYIDGPSLAEVVREGPLPAERAARYVELIAEAIHHAHQRGILHRDLKPSNVLIDPFDQPRVTDFGLAKRVDQDLGPTFTGQVLGSPGYMPPEQAAGRHSLIGVPSDVYALGAILYHLLTGQAPFAGESAAQVLVRLQKEEPTPPRTLNPGIPRDLETICLKCLRKQPADRYATAAELAADLRHWQKGERIAAQPQRAGGKLQSWCGEHPLAVFSAGLVALAVVQLGFAGWWFISRAHKSAAASPAAIDTGTNSAGTTSEEVKAPSNSQLADGSVSAPDAQPSAASPAADSSAVTPAATAPLPNLQPGQRWTNRLGVIFVPVPGTEVLFGVWDVRVQDYAAYAQANSGVNASWRNPGFQQGTTHPVVNVSWVDAKAFCAWLTRKEQAEGKLSGSQSYRLPADWEWSVAVGLSESRGGAPQDKDGKTPGVYPWGNQWPPPSGAGNYGVSLNVDSYDRTSPVGSFGANRYGLYDMGGNVGQWCEDFFDGQSGGRMLRGGSWFRVDSAGLLSSCRLYRTPGVRSYGIGFRCVLVVGGSASPAKLPAVAPEAKPEPGRSKQGKAAYSALDGSWENSLGMKFVPVVGTEVLFGVWDVRVKDFRAFAGDRAGNGGWDYQKGSEPYVLRSDGWKQRGWEYGWNNPGFAQTGEHPVTCVSWEDAKAFCAWLTRKEQAEGRLSTGQSYRLPTDAEWSVAVGLREESGGTPKDKDAKKDVYPWGTQWPPPNGAGNYAGEESKTADTPSEWGIISGYRDPYPRTSQVGSFRANQLGLYDMGGNVWQWCGDWYDSDQKYRVLRGGSWGIGDSGRLLSSYRLGGPPGLRGDRRGFRCVVVGGGVSAPH
jgi:formylglycine-generating enzyme required for sulfatase activity/serine/threonine protein kinase